MIWKRTTGSKKRGRTDDEEDQATALKKVCGVARPSTTDAARENVGTGVGGSGGSSISTGAGGDVPVTAAAAADTGGGGGGGDGDAGTSSSSSDDDDDGGGGEEFVEDDIEWED